MRLKPLLKRSLEPDVAHVAQNSHAIGENLTAHLLPPPAKGVVLGQVPASVRVNHTIKRCMISI